MGVSNLEARIKRLENTSSNEFGNPTSSILYPIRKLMLTEEESHDEGGVVFSVLVATWDKPAGLIFPETIRLIHNGTTVSLAGTATSYRMPGYLIGDTVTVNVTAMYLQGASSTVTAVKTITGDATPPSVPTNLTVTGGFRTLTLRWENPTTEDFSHVEVWESVIGPDMSTSERIAQAYGTEFVRSNCGVLEIRWYWIRALDVNGNFSDFTSVASGTTTAIAMEDVPDGTIEKSKLGATLASDIDLMSQRIDDSGNAVVLALINDYENKITQRNLIGKVSGDSIAAIEEVSTVVAGKARVYQQASAPTVGINYGDLWIDNNGLIHRWNGVLWADCKDKELADLMNVAVAQQWLKVQASTGGRNVIAGIGVMADASTGSEIAMLTDRFYLLTDVDGELQQPFIVNGVTGEVGINADLIVDGSIVGEKIFAGAKIQLGDGGEFITGANSIVQMASGVILLDSVNGVIQVKDPANITTGDYVKIDTGDVTTYKYINGSYAPMKSLRKMATGVATNNVTTTLPGAWPSIPEIIVSPKQLQSFVGGTYANSNQSMELAATNISRNGTTGVVTFVPQARLVISAGSGTVTPPASGSGVIATGAIGTSGTFYSGTASPAIGVTTLTISASCYGQAGEEWVVSGAGTYTYYANMTNVSYALYVEINGSSYLIKTGKFNRAVNDVSTEPSSALYAAGTASQTFTINGAVSTIRAYAVFTKADAFVSMDTSAALYGKVNKCWIKINSISYSLVGSEQLATGTLNYMAIAE